MVDARKVAQAIEKIAPESSAMEGDNVGVLLDCGNETNCVLFSLDVTPETLQEAVRLNCGILVTHHPVVMEPIRRFSVQDMIVQAARMGISLIAAHTSYDAARGGVNDVLCGLLGLRRVKPLGGLGRGGAITAMPEEEFAAYVKSRLGCDAIRVVPAGKEIKTVAVAGGSAGNYALLAAAEGYDALVTGELKHHEALAAKVAGVCVVCAGHFKTENPAMEHLRAAVGETLGRQAACVLSRDGADPFTYY